MIDSNSLIADISQIVNEIPQTEYTYSVVFILPDGTEVSPLALLGIEISRNCYKRYYDGIAIQAVFMAGEYNRLMRGQHYLLARLSAQPVASGTNIKNIPTIHRLLRAIPSEKNTRFMKGEYTGRDDDDLSITDSISSAFQLIDLAVEQFIHRTVSKNFVDMTALDVFRFTLGLTRDISLPEEAEIKGVDVAEYKDGIVWPDIIVPVGTSIPYLHDHLKKNYHGMYPTGAGWYFYKNHWFIYPKVNTDGTISTNKTLTVYNIPPDRYKGVENTYVEDGENIKIVATGDSVFRDTSVSSDLNLSSGLRYMPSDRFTEGLGKVENGRYVIDRNDNLTEYLIESSKTGFNNASFVRGGIGDNTEEAIGELYISRLKQVGLVWENSLESKIVPGMNGTYIQEDDKGIRSFHCMVMSSEHIISLVGNRATSEKFNSQSVLVLILGEEIL